MCTKKNKPETYKEEGNSHGEIIKYMNDNETKFGAGYGTKNNKVAIRNWMKNG